MTKLQEARARVREAKALIASEEARGVKAQAAAAPAKARRDRAHAALQKVPVLIARPQDRVERSTLDGISLSYLDVGQRQALEGTPASKRPAALAELLMAGAVKVNLAGEGTALTVRGLAAKTRTVDRAAIARIDRARKAMDRANAAANKARDAYHGVLKAEWKDGQSPAPADLAARWAARIIADLTAITLIRVANSNVSWESRRALEAATAHLAHVESRSKDPCPCAPCVRDANDRAWQARQAADAKARAKALAADAKARAKALASARKVSFTCPTCGQSSITVVDDDRIRCRIPTCRSNAYGGVGFALAGVKVKAQPKSATVGPMPA